MKIFFFFLAALVFFSSIVFSQDCDWCKRRAILELNNIIIDGSDPMYQSSVIGGTYEAVSPPCFFWMATADVLKQMNDMPEKKIMEYSLGHTKPPEYIFKALYENGLTGLKKSKKVILSDDTTDYWDASSRFTMELYYNGENEEFIESWVTLSTINKPSSHYGSMWRSRDAEMKRKKLLEVMYEFEQTPTECSVTPESETIAINDSMKIEISDFKGFYGGKPKSFNRIIVHALYGTITNGNKCDIGPDYKVFTLDNEKITLKYRSPGECEITEDRITVFNSCDILPKSKWPLEKTEMNERITEKNINISCWDATITIRKTVAKEIVKDKSEDDIDGDCKHHREEHYNLNETIDASVFVALELEYSVDMPLLNQTFEYYKPLNVNLSSFNYSSTGTKTMTGNYGGSGCAKGGYKTEVNTQRILNNRELVGEGISTQFRWILVIDNETNKAVKILPGGYGIDYKITETESMHSKVWSDNGTNEDSKTDTKNSDKSFELGPVADKIPDPTIKQSNQGIEDYLRRQGVTLPEGVNIPKVDNSDMKKEISPDILVKFGDGETSFGGEGSKELNEPNEYGYEKEKRNFSWNMTRKKKSK